MIDLHTHLLPGIDDGPATLAGSVAMARSIAEDGVRIVVATPHVRDDYPTTPKMMETALADVRAAVRDAGIPLDVLPGAEVALEEVVRLDAATLRQFGLGGNPHALLVEFPYHGWPLALVPTVARLVAEGVVPVIAHPERSVEVIERPERLAEVVGAGALVQLTAASLDGRLGRRVAGCARRLLDLELAHIVSSDAHTPAVRAAGLAAARDTVGGELGLWLVEAVPLAVLSGEEVPPRPRALSRLGRLLG